MLNAAGLELNVELEPKDREAYWKGRVFIEAARLAHDAIEDKAAFTMEYATFEPYLEQATALINAEKDCLLDDTLPDAVFEEGNVLEPRFVVLLALLIESEKHMVGEKTIKSLSVLSSGSRDKKIVVALNGHNTALSRHLALESGYEVRDSGLIEVAKAMQEKLTGFVELDEPRVRKEPDHNLRAVRQKHNRVGRHSGHQRFNAKPQRQNFKGRGR